MKQHLQISGNFISLATRLQYIIDTCLSLDAIHQKKMVHHDIKPENICIDPNTNTITITDFGLTKKYDSPQMKHPIARTAYLGTISYLPVDMDKINLQISYDHQRIKRAKYQHDMPNPKSLDSFAILRCITCKDGFLTEEMIAGLPTVVKKALITDKVKNYSAEITIKFLACLFMILLHNQKALNEIFFNDIKQNEAKQDEIIALYHKYSSKKFEPFPPRNSQATLSSSNAQEKYLAPSEPINNNYVFYSPQRSNQKTILHHSQIWDENTHTNSPANCRVSS
jgi:serine/threonine protein kinase